jgi:hypothetical protein
MMLEQNPSNLNLKILMIGRSFYVSIFITGLLIVYISCSPTANVPVNSTNSMPSPAGGDETNIARPTPAEIVRVTVEPVEIERGVTREVGVRLRIADGYHVNANPPSQDALIATELQIVSQINGVVTGAPIYPRGVTRRFSFSPQPLAVYEGEIEIRLPLRASALLEIGERNIGARLRVQPCDDTVCYPPRNFDFSIPVIIR